MESLGRQFDIGLGFKPVDMQTGTNTGARVNLRAARSLTVVLFKGAGTAGDDPVISLTQATASSGGSTSNLVAIDHYYVKTATTMTGAETWTRYTQSVSQTITDPGGLGTSAESQMICAIPVQADALSDGYDYVYAVVADTGSNAQLGCVFYLLGDLDVQRKPSNLPATLS